MKASARPVEELELVVGAGVGAERGVSVGAAVIVGAGVGVDVRVVEGWGVRPPGVWTLPSSPPLTQ
jgi:hypothetical protein